MFIALKVCNKFDPHVSIVCKKSDQASIPQVFLPRKLGREIVKKIQGKKMFILLKFFIKNSTQVFDSSTF
jgi:hypothetical protein